METPSADSVSTTPNQSDNTASMQQTPKGLRWHIGVFGRRNAGKSSLINAITRQQTCIVSDKPGTTTDPVEKAMEMLPLGPVLLIDTAGLDDDEEMLGQQRVERTRQALSRSDIALVVCVPGEFGPYEQQLIATLQAAHKPFVIVMNKADLVSERAEVIASLPKELRDAGREIVWISAKSSDSSALEELKSAIVRLIPSDLLEERPILSDLLPRGGTAVLVVPIDKEAPKGRLILPQVQTLRELLDASCTAMVCQVENLASTLNNLKSPPDLVVTDSQAFRSVDAIVPHSIPLTSFSVLFCRQKGDLATQVAGANHLLTLGNAARILVAEACTHHPIADDIGTSKIPRLIHKRLGTGIVIEHSQGRDFSTDLQRFDLVIHCGGCMLNRRGMLSRLEACRNQNVAVTNYGLAIAALLGILPRATSMFSLPSHT